jgi:hypothetical protein
MDKQGKSNYLFDHCLIQISDTFKTQPAEHFSGIIRNISPRFINPQRANYELDTLSVAKDWGRATFAKIAPFDLKGTNRTVDAGPDLGAFERVEKKK